jgi:hypothetical protein
MQPAPLTIFVLPDTFAVCRLPVNDSIPAWAAQGSFFSVTRTVDELSIVCDAHLVPPGVQCEHPWRAFKLEGPFPFELTGILLSVAAPLADAGISIFALATYDTDYVLVRETRWEEAKTALTVYGHHILP